MEERDDFRTTSKRREKLDHLCVDNTECSEMVDGVVVNMVVDVSGLVDGRRNSNECRPRTTIGIRGRPGAKSESHGRPIAP